MGGLALPALGTTVIYEQADHRGG
ncbi:MAG: hypothetical protein QOE61_4022, partial [Micromonosporaceae bacterium]|nr:hypothetical protein [Micromonosporaceae bacterium]